MTPQDRAARATESRAAALIAAFSVVRSIDPEDTDYADLDPLGQAIGNARIVLLGEQSHQDGATFWAKARLIRFLHERMGFDVLAWESGLYDCERMQRLLEDSSVPPRKALEAGIHPIWSASGHVEPVATYARATRATDRPLVMTGFDCQFSGDKASANCRGDLFAFLDAQSTPGSVPSETRAQLGTLMDALYDANYNPEPQDRERNQHALKQVRHVLERSLLPRANHRTVDFWKHVVANLETSEAMQADRRSKAADSLNRRDRAMGENLVWLAKERYAGKKIIVWAASAHSMRHASSLVALDTKAKYRDVEAMGQAVHRAFGTSAYSIAFTAYQGSYGMPYREARPVPTVASDSLEAALHDAGQPLVFVDFRRLPRKHWLRSPQVASPLGYSPVKADWTTVFDAMFFTDVMFSSTADGAVPDSARTKR